MWDPEDGRDWPAPAKLNLFLHLVGRRADGYHLLQTAFQFLGHGDTLHFRPRNDQAVRLLTPLPGVTDEDNLVLRAAHALRQAGGVRQGVDIALDKRLPAGSGLGGGSSDAATVLVALDHLWGLGLGTDRLAGLGLGLGADVPVFVRGRAAWAEGIGERLTPLVLPEHWYLVVTPPVHVATREVFGATELTRDCPPITISDFLCGGGGNVCEAVVCRRYPAVAEVLERLRQLSAAVPADTPAPRTFPGAAAGEVRMTGTGSSVFAAFDDEATARAVQRSLPPQWPAFVARGRNRSPLRDRLAGR